jgi:hypothetical protein
MQKDPSADKPNFWSGEAFTDLLDVIRARVAIIIDEPDNLSFCGTPADIPCPAGSRTRLSQNLNRYRTGVLERFEDVRRGVGGGIVDKNYLPIQRGPDTTEGIERSREELGPIARRYYNRKIRH